ncbi:MULTISPECIES: hypothetical protein [Prevotellaceae]|nr:MULTISPECIES: hypothetical protein [Prevotellaceae]
MGFHFNHIGSKRLSKVLAFYEGLDWKMSEHHVDEQLHPFTVK